jgi:hypothetical protein
MKPIYDAMFYQDQPSLIRRGLKPLYMFDDGVRNRATKTEADNSPGRPDFLFACRRVARDAVAVEKGIVQHQYRLPASYDAVEQPVCLDFEERRLKPEDPPWLMDRLYTENVEDDDRGLAAMQLAQGVMEMKREALGYGKKLIVGAYSPLLPYANNPQAKAAAQADWKPYLDTLDVAYVGIYPRSADLDEWDEQVDDATAACLKVLPGRKIIPLTVPHYGHEAPEDLRYKPLPVDFYAKAMLLLLNRPEVDGVGMWGGVQFQNNPDGTKRLPWSEVDKYLSAVTSAGRAANNPTR